MTDPLLLPAIEAARRGGEAIQAVQARPRQVARKGFRDEVTDADYAAEEAVVSAIRACYPDHPIVSEENDLGQDMRHWQPPTGTWWLIDPLDGTTNYSRGIPQYCVSVAVVQGLTVQAGAIYDPVRDQMFAAALGEGATLNGAPLHVSTRDDLTQAVIQLGLTRQPDLRRRSLAVLTAIAPRCRSVRTFGTSALGQAYVAAGWVEAFVMLRLQPWDVAAGSLLVTEAGGRLCLPGGDPWHLLAGQITATNAALHEVVKGVVGDALAAAE